MPQTMAHIFWKRRVIVLVHTKDSPTDPEWKRYCEDVATWRERVQSILVVSDGGGPNAVQRGELEQALPKFEGKTAVVTLNRIVRGIVTAMSWFNPNIKSFSTVQLKQAFEHLGIAGSEQDPLAAEVQRLKDELGISS